MMEITNEYYIEMSQNTRIYSNFNSVNNSQNKKKRQYGMKKRVPMLQLNLGIFAHVAQSTSSTCTQQYCSGLDCNAFGSKGNQFTLSIGNHGCSCSRVLAKALQ